MTHAQPVPPIARVPVDHRQITRGLRVVCSHGSAIGIVDQVEGDWIKLRPDTHGLSHFIPLHWSVRADDQLHIDRPARQAMMEWTVRYA